jgi:hypothetical protein
VRRASLIHGNLISEFGWMSTGVEPEIASLAWVLRVEWLIRPGSTIHLEPGRRYFARVGFAVVTAESVREREARMEAVAEHAVLRTVPLARVIATW